MDERRRSSAAYGSVGSGRSISRKKRRRQRRRIRRMVMLAGLVAMLVLGIWGIGVIFGEDQETAEGSSVVNGRPLRESVGQIENSGQAENAQPGDGQTGGAQNNGTADAEGGGQNGETEVADKPEDPGQAGDASQNEVLNYRSEDRPKVKGIYVTGPMAGNAAFDNLLTLVDDTELNAMVIDVKNDAGEITYKMNLDTASGMGACINYIRDMEGFMQRLKEHEVYTIARIVCFKDPYLAEHYPELALKKADGTAVEDGHGVAWVNPYKEEVWEYLIDVAKKAAEIGFDEIQFDYVRFPLGSEAQGAEYGVNMDIYTRQQAITAFLYYAKEELHEVGIPVTADVFGTIIGSQTDTERTGQDYRILGESLDAICPMVYPSHYGPGVFGLEVPDAKPYETVLSSMRDSVEELGAIPVEEQAVVRPWLQAFTANWVAGHISYGGEQIRAQIQAVYDAGYEEWILWNASNRYSADGLLSE